MLEIKTAILLGSFTGLFLWSSPDNNAAGFCQLVDTRGEVSGDCYVRAINSDAENWVKETHLYVQGMRDGNRVPFRVRGLLGSAATWGIATLNGSGFVLETSSAGGIERFEFTRSSPSVANSRMALIANRAHAAQGARSAEIQRKYVYADYQDLRERLPGVVEQIQDARADSVRGEEKLAAVKRRQLAIKDSIAHERIPWKIANLQTDLGFASTDENIARTDIAWATESIQQETRIAASMRAQITADSLFLFRARR